MIPMTHGETSNALVGTRTSDSYRRRSDLRHVGRSPRLEADAIRHGRRPFGACLGAAHFLACNPAGSVKHNKKTMEVNHD